MNRAPLRALRRRALAPFPLVLLCACGGTGASGDGIAPASTSPEITVADLRARLYAFADDSMQGRRSTTAGNVKATDWLAAEARRLGLEPAGEDGGWFQTVPLLRRDLDPATAITVEGQTFKAWTDLIPRDQGIVPGVRFEPVAFRDARGGFMRTPCRLVRTFQRAELEERACFAVEKPWIIRPVLEASVGCRERVARLARF